MIKVSSASFMDGTSKMYYAQKEKTVCDVKHLSDNSYRIRKEILNFDKMNTKSARTVLPKLGNNYKLS